MEIKKAEFIKSAVYSNEYPKSNNFTEFSFIGRSNVGKSSLINSFPPNAEINIINVDFGKWKFVIIASTILNL